MLSYEIDGSGPCLLLIHGFAISFHIWEELRPHLRDHFTLIVVELPGIGRSPLPKTGEDYLDACVREIVELQRALKIERWSILGYSSGARVAERYLQLHAERVERAVFLSPLRLTGLNAAGLKILLYLDRIFPQIGNWVLSGNRLRFLIRYLGFSFSANTLAPAWYAEMASQPAWILKETMRCLPDGGARPFAIPDVPALFVWGMEDYISAAPRASERDVLIHANHSAPQTAAPEVLRVVLPFLISR